MSLAHTSLLHTGTVKSFLWFLVLESDGHGTITSVKTREYLFFLAIQKGCYSTNLTKPGWGLLMKRSRAALRNYTFVRRSGRPVFTINKRQCYNWAVWYIKYVSLFVWGKGVMGFYPTPENGAQNFQDSMKNLFWNWPWCWTGNICILKENSASFTHHQSQIQWPWGALSRLRKHLVSQGSVPPYSAYAPVDAQKYLSCWKVATLTNTQI